MATYIIGDLQGCYKEFKALLAKIAFNPKQDTLYLVGDLINRGPNSLETLEYIYHHQESIFPVLGNHDLSYLVYAEGYTSLKPKDTYDSLLQSSYAEKYKEYLRHLPLLIHLPKENIAICHAGIYPAWSLLEAKAYAREIELQLKDKDLTTYQTFISTMFGNTPTQWDEGLTGMERSRFIINAFTRMRLLESDLRLNLTIKDRVNVDGLTPWFCFPRKTANTEIIYGHWASLGLHQENNTYGIDSGCVWGGKLSAIKVSQKPYTLFEVEGYQPKA